MRSSSRVIRSFELITSLKVSAIFPAIPVQSTGKRTEKSPRLKATSAARSCPWSSWLPLAVDPLGVGRLLVPFPFAERPVRARLGGVAVAVGETGEVEIDFFMNN